MFSDLGKLIISMQDSYDQICDLWDEDVKKKINLKKKCVVDVKQGDSILNHIFK